MLCNKSASEKVQVKENHWKSMKFITMMTFNSVYVNFWPQVYINKPSFTRPHLFQLSCYCSECSKHWVHVLLWISVMWYCLWICFYSSLVCTPIVSLVYFQLCPPVHGLPFDYFDYKYPTGFGFHYKILSSLLYN